MPPGWGTAERTRGSVTRSPPGSDNPARCSAPGRPAREFCCGCLGRLFGLVWDERRDVTFEWIKGHAGDPNNNRVERLARAAPLRRRRSGVRYGTRGRARGRIAHERRRGEHPHTARTRESRRPRRRGDPRGRGTRLQTGTGAVPPCCTPSRAPPDIVYLVAAHGWDIRRTECRTARGLARSARGPLAPPAAGAPASAGARRGGRVRGRRERASIRPPAIPVTLCRAVRGNGGPMTW
jgi:hypothetical protein